MLDTVSRESAPRSENFDSPETTESPGRANCFLTIPQTFSSVSGFACARTFHKNMYQAFKQNMACQHKQNAHMNQNLF